MRYGRIILFTKFMFIALLILFTNCKDQEDRVPFVVVDTQLNLALPIYQDLNIVGNWIYVSGGSQGIIVYRFSTDEFRAFDRHCTFNVPDQCRIEVDNSNIQAEDVQCCNSVFSIIDGTVQSGDAFVGLTQYQTSFFNNVVSITN
ncbi:MAG: hypothetical protein HKN39_07550 [Flavobacteriales bacterium]|nr:hypothetical protein [Flavobacteriales bacterium]